MAIVEKHAEQTRKRGAERGGTGFVHFRLSMPWRFDMKISEAAKRRGIGRAAYIRRALAHFVAADLGIDPAELISQCPLPTRWGEVRTGSSGRGLTDDGKGFGDWDLVRRGR
jgi:hypothetical protein